MCPQLYLILYDFILSALCMSEGVAPASGTDTLSCLMDKACYIQFFVIVDKFHDGIKTNKKFVHLAIQYSLTFCGSCTHIHWFHPMGYPVDPACRICLSQRLGNI